MPRSWTETSYLQGTSTGGATANGNGTTGLVAGVDGAQQVEVQETAGGTATLNLEGSFNGTDWYAVGYQQVDSIATPTRAVAAVAVTANSKHVYQVLDPYPLFRARLSAIAAATVTVRLYETA